MALPEIPVLEVQRYPPQFPDVNGDGDSDVLAALLYRGIPRLSCDGFTVYEHPSLKSHHPEGSTVYWFVEGDLLTTPNWDIGAWWRLASSPHTLLTLEEYVRDRQSQDPMVHWFMFMGHAEADETTNLDHFHPRGLPSKKRAHGHLVSSISLDIFNPVRFIQYENQEDLRDATLFMNAHGEALIRLFEDSLLDFGHKFTYKQQVGINEKTFIPRTMFGFPDLRQAVQKTLELQAYAERNWYEQTLRASEIMPSLSWLPGYMWDRRYSLAPGFAIILPNDYDRMIGGVDNTDPVWVMPFAHVSANQVLTQGGLVVKYFD